MNYKFKIGDRVVLIEPDQSSLGAKYRFLDSGVISFIRGTSRLIIRVELDRGKVDNYTDYDEFYEDELELEAVYNTPLWKALK